MSNITYNLKNTGQLFRKIDWTQRQVNFRRRCVFLSSFSLNILEILIIYLSFFQSWILNSHHRAIKNLTQHIGPSPRICVVGGGLFPRSLIVLQRLFPNASFSVIDCSEDSIKRGKARFNGPCDWICRRYSSASLADYDLIVFPLAFVGEKDEIYQNPPAKNVLVHDWIWNKHGKTTKVSWILLKRINLITQTSDIDVRLQSI